MQNKSWGIKAFLFTFLICMLISGVSNTVANNANIIVLVIITTIIIFIGIIFDIIGTAVLTADEATFHAKASNKIKGSRESIKLSSGKLPVVYSATDSEGSTYYHKVK